MTILNNSKHYFLKTEEIKLPMNRIRNTRRNARITNTNGNQNGDNTHHHDQVATTPTSTSLRTIKMIPKIVINDFIIFDSVISVDCILSKFLAIVNYFFNSQISLLHSELK